MNLGVKITEHFAQRMASTIRRVDGMPLSTGDGKIPVRFEESAIFGKGSAYFRLTESLTPCFSALGDEVQIVNIDCLQFEPVDGGMTDQEVFDCSNSVRVFNLVSQEEINTAAPIGTVVEAVQDTKHGAQEASGDSGTFWRILQVLSCDCGASSSSSSIASSSGSSSSSSASSSDSSRSSESSSAPSSGSGSSGGGSSGSGSSGGGSSGSGSSGSGSSGSGSSGSGSSGSGSSGSGSSGGGSSGSGSSASGGSGTIEVVTDVQCVNGSIEVTKTTILVAGG